MIIRDKTCFVYDIEVFPNFISIAIKNTESGNIRTFYIGFGRNDLGIICKLFLRKDIFWVGYNSIHYDAPIVSYLMLNYKSLRLLPI